MNYSLSPPKKITLSWQERAGVRCQLFQGADSQLFFLAGLASAASVSTVAPTVPEAPVAFLYQFCSTANSPLLAFQLAASALICINSAAGKLAISTPGRVSISSSSITTATSDASASGSVSGGGPAAPAGERCADPAGSCAHRV